MEIGGYLKSVVDSTLNLGLGAIGMCLPLSSSVFSYPVVDASLGLLHCCRIHHVVEGSLSVSKSHRIARIASSVLTILGQERARLDY
jgi:hypothetical protein